MSIVDVKVPQLSESVAEATLLQWKKQPGEAVAMDEILIEIETDKVVLEVPAPAAGVLAEHVVAGGGTALLRARASLQGTIDGLSGDEATGARSVFKALAAPARHIADNAGIEGAVAVQRTEAESGPVGLNAATGNFEDLIKAGVIDPAKVTRAALQNAASIAGLLLTTECLVADKPEEAPTGGGMPDMGGMGGMM